MTSDLNHNIIQQYFKENDFFNYPKEDVLFFEQGLELCLTKDGKIIIESPTSLALAPDGNGGIFAALRVSGALDDIVSRGVRHLHVYGIDNIMTRAADPRFIGLCIRDNAEVGNKVVPRLNKDEKVGVTVIRQGRMYVAEYSELPPEIASSVDPTTGTLLFDAANICNHYFSVEFIRTTLMSNLSNMYHLASKKIPYMNSDGVTVTPTTDNGFKLETFIFDCFPLATRFSVLSGPRDDEFAPVKNHPGASSDTPESAVAMLSRQGLRWLREAGAVIAWKRPGSDANAEGDVNFVEEDLQSAITRGEVLCEISPLLSYEGENLDAFRDQRVVLPCSLSM
jgi:UDP-N-acetylglucosamine/UDP-N-acetylgalactosamine diphosphorylase